MAIAGPLKVDCGEVFPHGLGVVGEVTSLDDFNASTKENRVQARDKETGLPMWRSRCWTSTRRRGRRRSGSRSRRRCSRSRRRRLPGLPVRPVVLEGLTVTPYIKDGPRPRIGYSLRCTGLAAPGRRADTKAA